MATPTLSPNGKFLLVELHQGRNVKPPPGMAGGALMSVPVGHVTAVADFLYRGDDGEMLKATNLLLVNSQWITVCGDPSEVATLLGYFDTQEDS